MPQKKIKCQYCHRMYASRAIIIVHNWVGCRDCIARLSKGLKPLKYGRNPKKVKK
jgi:hypothetical protein